MGKLEEISPEIACRLRLDHVCINTPCVAFPGTQRYFSEVGNVDSECAVVKVTCAAPQLQPPAQCAQDEFSSISVLPFLACLQRKARISVYVWMPSYLF